MKQVVILEPLGISEEELAGLERPFADRVCFQAYERTADMEKLKKQAQEADALILANMPLCAEVIRSCPHLAFIDIAFTGVDHVALDAAAERGIAVSNASGYSDEAVAELVLGAVLSMARNLRAAEERCRTGGTRDGLLGWEIKGKTVGIVGLGRIGSRTAELFHAFGARVLASSRHIHENAPAFVEQVPLPELLSRSDIVSLHCPLNDSTIGLIDAKKLSLMKPSALLVNAARGPVVDEKALCRALKENRLAGACVDVFEKEPPLSAETPLLSAPRTLLTPHVAFATKESMSLRARIVFDNLAAWLNGSQQNKVL